MLGVSYEPFNDRTASVNCQIQANFRFCFSYLLSKYFFLTVFENHASEAKLKIWLKSPVEGPNFGEIFFRDFPNSFLMSDKRP